MAVYQFPGVVHLCARVSDFPLVWVGDGVTADEFEERNAESSKEAGPDGCSWVAKSVVTFKANSDFRFDDMGTLNQSAATIRRLLQASELRRVSVLVEGHTTTEEAPTLALARARTVAQCLSEHGVPAESIVAAEAVINERRPIVTVRVLA